MINAGALRFTDQPVVLSREECRRVAEVTFELAGRLERESSAAARKKAKRFQDIARAIATGEAVVG